MPTLNINAFSCLRYTRAATSWVKKVQIKTLEDRMKENCTEKRMGQKIAQRIASWRMRGREKEGLTLPCSLSKSHCLWAGLKLLLQGSKDISTLKPVPIKAYGKKFLCLVDCFFGFNKISCTYACTNAQSPVYIEIQILKLFVNHIFPSVFSRAFLHTYVIFYNTT